MVEVRDGVGLLRPAIFSPLNKVVAGVTTRINEQRSSHYGLNTSWNVGDEPAQVERNRRAICIRLGIDYDRLATAGQIHGDTVTGIKAPGRYERCDGLVTRTENLWLSVTVADCVPILLYDPARQIVAAVHAGWRGCRSRILRKTLDVMKTRYDSHPADLYAYIGPSAGICCYEIGHDVANFFPATYLQTFNTGNHHLDMKAINQDILLESGLNNENIEISEYCTICNSALFHSFRRDGSRSGRMMAIIGLRSSL